MKGSEANTPACSVEELQLQRLRSNYPGYHMYKNSEIGDFFWSFIFTNIKNLNDQIGQLPVDDTLKIFKSTEQLSELLKLWDDYKNYVLKIDENHNTPITDEELESVMDQAFTKVMNVLDFDNDTLITPGFSQMQGSIEDYGTLMDSVKISLGKIRMKLEKITSGISHGYLEFFDPNFQIDKNLLSKYYGAKHTEKLYEESTLYIVDRDAFFIIEEDGEQYYKIFSPDGTLTKRIQSLYLTGKIPKQLQLHHALSQTLYVKETQSVFAEQAFNSENNKLYQVASGNSTNYRDAFLIITDENNNSQRVRIFEDNIDDKENFFSQTLITMVRKKKLPESMALYKKIRMTLDMLICDAEAIFPDWNESSPISYEEYSDLVDKIRNNQEYDLDLFHRAYTGYFKGGLNQETFRETLQNTSGQLFFIDIKDMGSINMKDFHTSMQGVLRGEISHEEAILQSGSLMTRRFQNIINDLENVFRKESIHFTVGGDEIKVFIEGNVSTQKTCAKLHNIIMKQSLFGRITTAKKEKNDDGIGIIDSLDKTSSLSKEIEEVYAIIERRLSSQIRELEEEYDRFRNRNTLLMTDIRSLKDIADTLQKVVFERGLKKINALSKRLKALYSFHIELNYTNSGTKNANIEDSVIVVRKKKFIIGDIFDVETRQLQSDTKFTQMLDELGLER